MSQFGRRNLEIEAFFYAWARESPHSLRIAQICYFNLAISIVLLTKKGRSFCSRDHSKTTAAECYGIWLQPRGALNLYVSTRISEPFNATLSMGRTVVIFTIFTSPPHLNLDYQCSMLRCNRRNSYSRQRILAPLFELVLEHSVCTLGNKVLFSGCVTSILTEPVLFLGIYRLERKNLTTEMSL